MWFKTHFSKYVFSVNFGVFLEWELYVARPEASEKRPIHNFTGPQTVAY